MKVLDKQKLKDSNQFEHTITERCVLQHVEHPFLVTLQFAFQSNNKLYMVMDFVNGGELFFHLRRNKRFKEERAKFYAAEIFLALEHLHSLNIIYR
jgi:serine/threonine protein kinase